LISKPETEMCEQQYMDSKTTESPSKELIQLHHKHWWQ